MKFTNLTTVSRNPRSRTGAESMLLKASGSGVRDVVASRVLNEPPHSRLEPSAGLMGHMARPSGPSHQSGTAAQMHA
jgi:hypothetical protein